MGRFSRFRPGSFRDSHGSLKGQGFYDGPRDEPTLRGEGASLQRPDLDEIHEKMQAKLGGEGVAFDAIYVFTGEPGTEVVGETEAGEWSSKPLGAHLISTWALPSSSAMPTATSRWREGPAWGPPFACAGKSPWALDADHEVGDLHELRRLLSGCCLG